mgnify:CR=1 FL=1
MLGMPGNACRYARFAPAILGAGPVFLLPTGSDDLLTSDKWGAGPSIVARYWADGPDGGADGFGLRLFVTLLFPR